MPQEKKVTINCAPLGCLCTIAFIFILGALWYKLPTPWGSVEIDIFPPGLFIDR
jgi:hypothetical protein